MLPKPEKVKAGAWRTTLFRLSSDFHADDGSLLGLMAMRYVPPEGIRGHQQLWDAVAVALMRPRVAGQNHDHKHGLTPPDRQYPPPGTPPRST